MPWWHEGRADNDYLRSVSQQTHDALDNHLVTSMSTTRITVV